MRGVKLLTIVEDEPDLERTFLALGVAHTWSEHQRFTAEIPAYRWEAVNASVGAHNWTVTSLVEDVQDQIDAENAARLAHPYPPTHDAQRRPEFYAAIRNIEEVNAHIDYLVELGARVPGLTVERFVYGRTHFGREQVAIRVHGDGLNGTVPKFWQHGLQHGGEWITTMVTLFIAEALIEGFADNDERIVRLVLQLEWIFAPVVNVDGFVHSWSSASTRNWRKSRQMHPENVAAMAECLLECEPECAPNACAGCVGTDTNRNWPFEWGPEHASDNPCSNAYHGPEPETEPENRNLAAFIRLQQTDPATAVIGAIDHHWCAYGSLAHTQILCCGPIIEVGG
eukprot:COSAG02_NODE_468_length_21758_cov_41.206796_4_plen_340_part_00